jgi:dolichol kinase
MNNFSIAPSVNNFSMIHTMNHNEINKLLMRKNYELKFKNKLLKTQKHIFYVLDLTCKGIMIIIVLLIIFMITNGLIIYNYIDKNSMKEEIKKEIIKIIVNNYNHKNDRNKNEQSISEIDQ